MYTFEEFVEQSNLDVDSAIAPYMKYLQERVTDSETSLKEAEDEYEKLTSRFWELRREIEELSDSLDDREKELQAYDDAKNYVEDELAANIDNYWGSDLPNKPLVDQIKALIKAVKNHDSV